MPTTTTRILMAVLTVLTLAAFTAPAALAGSDLPSGPGVIPDTVMVSGRYTATGYTGGFFNRERITVSDTFVGSAAFAVGDRGEVLWDGSDCAGDFALGIQANVMDRRDDGAVRVQLVVWTFDACRLSFETQRGWNIEYAWIAPGEASELEVFARNFDGAATVSATFTNIWAPKIDLSSLMRPYLDWSDFYMLNVGPVWETRAAFAAQRPQPAQKPDPAMSRSVDRSKLDGPVATVPVPVPSVNLDPDPEESKASDEIDLAVVVDLELPTINVPTTPLIGGSFDF